MKYSLLSVLVGSLLLSGCGGGEEERKPSVTQEPTKPITQEPTKPIAGLTAKSFISTDKQSASVQLESKNGSKLDYLIDQTANGKMITQAVTTEKNGTTTRTLFDSSGNIDRIIDEKTGSFIQFYWQSNRLIVTNHDNKGVYQSGSVVSYDQNGKLGIAPIVGTPSFTGQIVGQVQSSDPGAYTLVPKNQIDDLKLITGDFQALPDEMQEIIKADALVPSAKAKAVNSLDTDNAFSWINESWKNSFAEQTQQNRRGLLTGLVLGSACAGFVPGCQAVGVAVAGTSAAMLIGGFTAQQGGLRVINDVNTDVGLPPVVEGLNSKLNRFRDSLINAWQQGANLVEATKDAIQTIIDKGVDKLPTYTDVLSTSSTSVVVLQNEIDKATLPTAQSVPIVNTPVSGILANNSGQTYSLDGTVGVTGQINVTGQQNNGSQLVTLQGNLANNTVTGTYKNNGGDTGAISGQNDTLGQCATQQQSGGQGSFSYAYNMGAGKGDVSVSYSMYSIPDRMDVFTLNSDKKVQVLTTDGLVSGDGSGTFQVAPYTTVFISMTAPRSGTAWDFELTCPTSNS